MQSHDKSHNYKRSTMGDRKQGFLSLIERSTDPIVLLDGKGVTECNQAAVGLFGCRGKDEILNRCLSDLSPRKQPDGTLSKQKERTLITGAFKKEALRFEWMFRKPDGEEFPAEVTLGTIGCGTRELLRAALRRLVPPRSAGALPAETENTYRSMFENATEGMFRVAPAGHFLSVNPALARIAGYDSPEEMMNQTGDLARQAYVSAERRRECVNLLETEGRVSNFECQLRRKDGSTHWVSFNSHVVHDEAGKVLSYEGHLQDITERKLAEEQLMLQRDLALELARVASLDEALSLTIRAVTQTTGCECVGIYLTNSATGELELASSAGLSEEFLKKIPRVTAGLDKPVHFAVDENMDRPYREALVAEGIRSVALIPILYQGGIIACFNAASHRTDTIPASSRSTLEFIGAQFGNIIARLQAEQELQKDLERRKQIEEALETKTRSLEEVNAALKVLLNGRDKDNNELTGKVMANVEQLIQPYVRRLKASKLDVSQTAWIDIIETNLREITSSFLKNINVFDFTPKELEVIQFLKEGRSSQEIADLLNVCSGAVQMHRHRIRKKLGLNKKKTNLQSYLFSLV
jgi:PAS domain S-box-containing protein